MNKKLQLFALFMFTTHGLTAFNDRKMFGSTTQWDFLEKTFIVDAHAEKQEFFKYAQASLPFLGCAIASYKYLEVATKMASDSKKQSDAVKSINTLKEKLSEEAQEVLDEINKNKILKKISSIEKDVETMKKEALEAKDFIKDLLNPKNLYFIGAIVSAGIVCTQAIQYYMNYYVNRQIVADFLHNWNYNKALTPVEFCDAFEALASIMDVNGDEAVLQHATEIVDIMQFMIIRHFDKRYESVLKVQAINNIGDAKSIVDLLKTTAEAAKNIGA